MAKKKDTTEEVAAATPVVEAPKPTTKSSKIPKLAKKDKQRLPRKAKKLQQKLANAKKRA
jgi:hypothetical protein